MSAPRIKPLMPLALAVLVLFLCSCGGTKTEETAKANETKTTPQIGAVTTVRPTIQLVSAAVQATGSFAAQESSNVAPETPGVLVATLVDVGDFVKEGQIIARLDDRDAKLRLDQVLAAQQQAEAAVRQAQSKIGLAQNQDFVA